MLSLIDLGDFSMSRIIKFCNKIDINSKGNIENITVCFVTYFNSDTKFMFLL